MPPVSRKQQRFAGAELQRAREGKKTRSGMSKEELEKLATVPKGKKLPEKAKAKK